VNHNGLKAVGAALALLALVVVSCDPQDAQDAQDTQVDPNKVAVEVLKFKVNQGTLENWINKDREIWTAKLQSYPGFIRKEVWTNPENPEEVTAVIYWATREQWKAIPQAELDETDRRFIAAVGADTFQFVSGLEYKPWVFTQ
jgi:uncharacterized protein (TIGR03792 family)